MNAPSTQRLTRLGVAVLVVAAVVFLGYKLSHRLGGGAGSGGHGEQAQGEIIGFVLASSDNFESKDARAVFEKRVAEHGAKMAFASANNREQEQYAKFETLVNAGAKVIVLQAVRPAFTIPFVELAKKNKVKLIAFERAFTDSTPDLFVGADPKEAASFVTTAALASMGNKGDVIFLRSSNPAAIPEVQLVDASLEILQKENGIKVVMNEATDSSAGAETLVDKALKTTHGGPLAVIATSSGLAEGAVRALERNKMTGRAFVAGAGGALVEFQNIAHGKQQLELLYQGRTTAMAAADAALSMILGKTPEGVQAVAAGGGGGAPILRVPAVVVDKTNLESEVVGKGLYTSIEVKGEDRPVPTSAEPIKPIALRTKAELEKEKAASTTKPASKPAAPKAASPKQARPAKKAQPKTAR